MNNIPPDLIINWYQTGLKIVPTGEWTMNLAGEKVISIIGSDDKREKNRCFSSNTYSEKYLPPQLLYKGMTKRCHPVVAFPCGWDIWHSSNHWSNEDAIKRYLDTIMIRFVNEQCKKLFLSSIHQALVTFDGLRGQNTTEFLSILEKNNSCVEFHLTALTSCNHLKFLSTNQWKVS